MKNVAAFVLLIVLAACGAPQQTPAPTVPSLTIEDAWAAPSPGGADVAAGYLTIRNASAQDDRLLSVSSPRAERVELHETQDDAGVMRMRAVQELTAPAGAALTLAPRGTHLMFIGATAPFTPGERIPVTLVFERAGPISVELDVRTLGPTQDAHRH